MQNQEIVKIIENLKGRRGYEEKKVSEDEKKELEEIKDKNELTNEDKNKNKKSCSCC